MIVKISTNENVVIVTIEGSIDSKTSGGLQAQIMEKVSEMNNALLDFSKVDFVSSAGLRVLLMVYRQIKSKNGKVILAGVSDEIKDVMSMTGFISFFRITDTVDSALKLL